MFGTDKLVPAGSLSLRTRVNIGAAGEDKKTLREIVDYAVTQSNWARFIAIVISVAGEPGIGETEGGEVLVFLESLKSNIVTS